MQKNEIIVMSQNLGYREPLFDFLAKTGVWSTGNVHFYCEENQPSYFQWSVQAITPNQRSVKLLEHASVPQTANPSFLSNICYRSYRR